MFILVCERRSWCYGGSVALCFVVGQRVAVCPKIGYPKIPQLSNWRRTSHFWPSSPRAQTKHSKSRSASCTQLLGLAYHRRNPLGWEADEILRFLPGSCRPQISITSVISCYLLGCGFVKSATPNPLVNHHIPAVFKCHLTKPNHMTGRLQVTFKRHDPLVIHPPFCWWNPTVEHIKTP